MNKSKSRVFEQEESRNGASHAREEISSYEKPQNQYF